MKNENLVSRASDQLANSEAGGEHSSEGDARLPDIRVVYGNPILEEMIGYLCSEEVGCNCRFLQGSEVNHSQVSAVRTAVAE